MQQEMKTSFPALKAIFGMSTEVTNDEFKKSLTAVKDSVKFVSLGLGEGDWIAGTAEPSVADFLCAQLFTMAFQTMLDAGFCKAKPNVAAVAWFKRVIALPAFIAINGKVAICDKVCKPILKAEVKKAAPPKETPEQIAAKKAAKEAVVKVEKPKAGLDALPESDFDLYGYKTFLVNETDRKGAGMAKTKEMF